MRFLVNHNEFQAGPCPFLATSPGLVKGRNPFWFLSSWPFRVLYRCYGLDLGAFDLKTLFIH